MSVMNAFPPVPGCQVTLANWRQSPFNHWAFHHVREVVPSAPIRRGERIWRLPRAHRSIEGITFPDRNGARHVVGAALEETFTDAMVVLHRGHVVHERYDHGMDPADPHILMSVSKSLTAALVGVLAGRGIVEPEAPVIDYVPEVAGSAYEGATVRHLLDMRVGADFDEDYTATSGIMMDYRAATAWNPTPEGWRELPPQPSMSEFGKSR